MTRKPRSIEELRAAITDVDQRLLDLLAERRELSEEVIRAKEERKAGIRDAQREEEILDRLVQEGRARGLDGHYVTRVFHQIIDDSLRRQQRYLQRGAAGKGALRVAIQGVAGAYSHLAAQKFFASEEDRLRIVECETFQEVIESVEQGRSDHAMLPIENTTSGGINEVYDLLLHTTLSIVGEEVYRVDHCLVAAQPVELSSIRTVFSHPQAVAQCTRFLHDLGCKVEYFTDTAMSAAKIREDEDPTQAAIASEDAARRHQLSILARHIANQRDNFTRFLVAARKPQPVDLRVPAKTSCVLATGQRPGALVDALTVFRDHGLVLTKLESRPILGNPFEEMFYVDFGGNVADAAVTDCLKELARATRFLKVLGTYPSEYLPKTHLPAASFAGAPAPEPAPTSSEPDRKVVRVNKVEIGGGDLVVLAGPVRVEDEETLLACARQVRERGGSVLTGSCLDPQGALDETRLHLLVEAGRHFGLPTLTEVSDPTQVPTVAAAVDVLQIGARHMENETLLREVGRGHRPVVLRRGPTASLEELQRAAEAILTQGNQQVILCETGIRTVESSRRRTLDLSAVPILRSRTGLPVMVDPSGAAEDAAQLLALARAAQAAGADALMLPLGATTSADASTLDADAFADTMRQLFPRR